MLYMQYIHIGKQLLLFFQKILLSFERSSMSCIWRFMSCSLNSKRFFVPYSYPWWQLVKMWNIKYNICINKTAHIKQNCLIYPKYWRRHSKKKLDNRQSRWDFDRMRAAQDMGSNFDFWDWHDISQRPKFIPDDYS